MMDVKAKNSGFTLVELLTILAIITMLVGLLIPALAAVRRFAKETQQTVQLVTIDMALTAFKIDYGDYPPSDWNPNPLDPASSDYCGAQKLAEALFGQDLLGFHPQSAWRADGTDEAGDPAYIQDTLSKRRGPYLDSTANAFKLGTTPRGDDGLFRDPSSEGIRLAPDSFVICDVFGVRPITLPNGKIVKAGTPILYYKADTSKTEMNPDGWTNSIYDAYDNYILVGLGALTPDGSLGKPHKLGLDRGRFFYSTDYKIIDPKVITRPHRPDSYILISAGADGEYGTGDDICNF